MKSHKKRWKDKGNPRYRLNSDEAQIINDYRRLKLEAEAEGLNPNDIHSGWIKNKKASLYFKNPNFKQNDLKEFKKQLLNDLKRILTKLSKAR